MDTFKTHWQGLDAEQKLQLAKSVDCNKDYLSRVAHGHANVSLILARCLSMDLEAPIDELFPNRFPLSVDPQPFSRNRVDHCGAVICVTKLDPSQQAQRVANG